MAESDVFVGGIAVIFPGQGGQAPQMGAPWRNADGWWVVDRASEVLGEDVAELLLTDDPERLARTREAQLAVLVTSLVAWESGPLDQSEAVVAMAESCREVLQKAGVEPGDLMSSSPIRPTPESSRKPRP